MLLRYFILLLFIFQLQVAYASFTSKCARFAIKLRDISVKMVTSNFAGATFETGGISEKEGWKLVLEKNILGAGVSAGVYPVRELIFYGSDVQQFQFEKLIAKIPHCWRWNNILISYCQSLITEEELMPATPGHFFDINVLRPFQI